MTIGRMDTLTLEAAAPASVVVDMCDDDKIKHACIIIFMYLSLSFSIRFCQSLDVGDSY